MSGTSARFLDLESEETLLDIEDCFFVDFLSGRDCNRAVVVHESSLTAQVWNIRGAFCLQSMRFDFPSEFMHNDGCRLILEDQFIVCGLRQSFAAQPHIFSKPPSKAYQHSFHDVTTGVTLLTVFSGVATPQHWSEGAFSADELTVAVVCDCGEIGREVQKVSLFKLDQANMPAAPSHVSCLGKLLE